jgi:Holliday junction DNA helicase RuvA
MIGQLNGILLEKNPPQVLVDCAGVGYEVDVPMSTFYQLPACGERVKLMIHFVVREDAQILYGFASLVEKNAFKQLVRISGVGPRTALGVLSGMSVQELAQAVTLQESARLTKIPGIGKKTAERLLLELRGKLTADLSPLNSAVSGLAAGDSSGEASEMSQQNDILSALIALGYSERDALLALKSLPPGTGVAEGIKAALRAMSK